MFVPEGQKPFPRTIIDKPFISKYVDGWGEQNSDIGLIVEKDNHPIGAIWLHRFDEAHKEFGYVDDETPEIGIAILEEFRGEGIGTALMCELEVQARSYGYKKLCLRVDPTNPARRLYERFGYVHVGWCDTSWTDDEALRDLMRAREATKEDQLRARHQLIKFLLQHEVKSPEKE
ncbi:GNAT family N-acetyltransferase [Sulfoacidibacillus thermotolerans]|uniref:N-acetyltransferase domain-containing protein n=1 Tax=Sulfoacidibacillus thermotolerans TaxID=1765684 RepID=A0A2U3D727_SULT2|nr:GNAT family N-acetyltransferase [Sulfoacidibacillus thermotolerans]PWI57085.1 hypothetical protein BM613_10570 [Sulfoacidibacillus thermotolerans]